MKQMNVAYVVGVDFSLTVDPMLNSQSTVAIVECVVQGQDEQTATHCESKAYPLIDET